MLINLFSYLIIPIYTIALAVQDDLFESNLSVISSSVEHKDAFMLWGFMIVAYIYLVLTKVIQNFKLKFKKIDYTLITSSCVLLLLSFTTPYSPEESAIKANMHIAFAFSSTLLLLLGFLFITWELQKNNFKKYKRHFICAIIIDVISAILFLGVGIVSGFLEVFITISSTLLAKSLLSQSQLENSG
ncbi:MAG: hypothetical protein ACLRZ7_04420 [Lachnospiraceae bacterium]